MDLEAGEGAAGDPGPRWSTTVLVAAAVASVMLGCGPYSRHYRDGTWPLDFDPRVITKDQAVASVPAEASASVAYNIDTHMTHRAGVYEFPVPWCNINWGVRGENLTDPATVQYLLVDRNILTSDRGQGPARRTCWRASSPSSPMIEGILVAKRVHPPDRARGSNPPEGECFARPRSTSFQPDLQAGSA